MPTTPFQRLILRAVLRDVYPMVIRLVAVADCVDLTDFDDIFRAVLGWLAAVALRFTCMAGVQQRSSPDALHDAA